MASPTQVVLTPQHRGQFSVDRLTEASAKRASELLMKNHEAHHIFFNTDGLHNHIAHHMLALFPLGASPEQLQRGYDDNDDYQMGPYPVHGRAPKSFHDRDKFRAAMGRDEEFSDFLAFFKGEMESKGVERTVNEYFLAGDDFANALFARLFAGVLHPLIHFGYGIEFEQPVVLAEAMAECAVYAAWTADFLLELERAADDKSARGPAPESASLHGLLEEALANKKIVEAPHWEDANKIRDGLLVRAKAETAGVLARYTLDDDSEAELAFRAAEITNFCAYIMAASQREGKMIKMDFFLMHTINCSIFLPRFLAQPWISPASKRRFLEFKGRLDVALLLSLGCRRFRPEEIRRYAPKRPAEATWEAVIARVNEHRDDGHAAKLVRALANGERLCLPYEGDGRLLLKNKDWLQIANMVIDSVEGPGPEWVRSAGFDQAWKDIPDREEA